MFRTSSSARIVVLALIALTGPLTSTGRSQSPKPADEVQVLFIGNSLTQYNDMPKMLVELAKAGQQKPLSFEQVTAGGATLERLWKEEKALAKIQSRKWDWVVLQESIAGPIQKRAAMFEYGKKFDAEIRKQGAKTLLYMTWANKDRPKEQAAISKAYLELAKELKAEVAPVGQAWESAMAADQTLNLHDQDKVHPNNAGSYLAACVIYAAIYHKSPEGLPGKIGKITEDEAKPLQTLAWKAVEKKEN